MVGTHWGLGGGFVGRVPPKQTLFPRWFLFPAGRYWERAGSSLLLVQIRSVCTVSLADAEQAQLRSGAEGIGSSRR